MFYPTFFQATYPPNTICFRQRHYAIKCAERLTFSVLFRTNLMNLIFNITLIMPLSYFFRQPMILAQFAFLKGTLQSELPSRVSCSFSLSSLPFCAFCPNAEGAKICLLQGLPYTVVPTPILHILLIAAKIATQKKLQKQETKIIDFTDNIFFFFFVKKERKKIYLLLLL